MINGLTRVTTKRLSYDQQTVFPSFKNRKEGLVIKKSNPEEKSTLGTKRDLKKVCTSRKPICSKLQARKQSRVSSESIKHQQNFDHTQSLIEKSKQPSNQKMNKVAKKQVNKTVVSQKRHQCRIKEDWKPSNQAVDRVKAALVEPASPFKSVKGQKRSKQVNTVYSSKSKFKKKKEFIPQNRNIVELYRQYKKIFENGRKTNRYCLGKHTSPFDVVHRGCPSSSIDLSQNDKINEKSHKNVLLHNKKRQSSSQSKPKAAQKEIQDQSNKHSFRKQIIIQSPKKPSQKQLCEEFYEGWRSYLPKNMSAMDNYSQYSKTINTRNQTTKNSLGILTENITKRIEFDTTKHSKAVLPQNCDDSLAGCQITVIEWPCDDDSNSFPNLDF